MPNTDHEIIDGSKPRLRMFGFRFTVEHIAAHGTKPIEVVRLAGASASSYGSSIRSIRRSRAS